jgi:hypothetical protein
MSLGRQCGITHRSAVWATQSLAVAFVDAGNVGQKSTLVRQLGIDDSWKPFEQWSVIQRNAKPGMLEGVDPCQQRAWICARKNAHKACWCWGGFKCCKVGSIRSV